MLVIKQLTVAIDVHSIFFSHTVEVNVYRQLCSTEETYSFWKIWGE